MYGNEMDSVLSAMYAPNDRLGVELMGATKWNGLKKAVSKVTADAINKATNGVNIVPKAQLALKMANYVGGPRRVILNGDPLCSELFGPNVDFAAELLGESALSKLWSGTKKVTHKILEAGENIPVADAAVSRFRDIASVFSTGSKAADTATTLYENRGKVILICAGGGLLLYFLLRKKK